MYFTIVVSIFDSIYHYSSIVLDQNVSDDEYLFCYISAR